jgi:hypothetical protein
MLPSKRWLIGVVLTYVAASGAYFIVPPASFFLKYVITIGGILLGTVVREAANKEWKVLRIIAICVPLVAVAMVQAHEGHKSSRDRAADEAKKSRERARDVEAKVREKLVLDPRDAIEAIRNADDGFVAKAEVLAFRATLKQPSVDAARLKKLESSYRQAAADFANNIKPQYQKMLALPEKSATSEDSFNAQLHAVIQRVAGIAATRAVAGVYNHAGALAQAARRGDQALAYFYRALTLEPDHLPAYESLGYALWIFNQDAYGALQLAARGLEQCVLQRAQLGDRKAIRYAAHLERMESNLKLQYAYFSAILFANEKEARGYAVEQLTRDPNDAEAQDVMAYVMLRFADDADEVAKAMALFEKAIANPRAERITKRLATAHLHQAQETLTRLRR